MLPAYYQSLGPYESSRIKSFKKFEQKDDQKCLQSQIIQKNAISTRLKFETRDFFRIRMIVYD